MPKYLSLLLVAAVAISGACSSDDDNTPTDDLTVNVQDNSYSPATKTIVAGQTVTWKWIGASAHSVTFSGTASSPTQSSGTYQQFFETPGTYDYQCLVHGTAMKGTIVVTAP